jgi:hypothetical protein
MMPPYTPSTILVIDNNRGDRHLLDTIFRHKDYEVLLAENESKAWSCLWHHRDGQKGLLVGSLGGSAEACAQGFRPEEVRGSPKRERGT